MTKVLAVMIWPVGTIENAENHMVSGNPHRLGRRRVELRLDDAWRDGMDRRDRLLTTLLTPPLNLPYLSTHARRPPLTGSRSLKPS